jgi:hypothetical protein
MILSNFGPLSSPLYERESGLEASGTVEGTNGTRRRIEARSLPVGEC